MQSRFPFFLIGNFGEIFRYIVEKYFRIEVT